MFANPKILTILTGRFVSSTERVKSSFHSGFTFLFTTRVFSFWVKKVRFKECQRRWTKPWVRIRYHIIFKCNSYAYTTHPINKTVCTSKAIWMHFSFFLFPFIYLFFFFFFLGYFWNLINEFPSYKEDKRNVLWNLWKFSNKIKWLAMTMLKHK